MTDHDEDEFIHSNFAEAELKALKGKKAHYCPYVGHQPIDEHSEEFECCECDFDRGEHK